ncbi:hypothetical protein MICRO80W_680004 [Micrococcus luteus]|nr:hypothetical protein MICRO80W_680004 [Micrococcus luteus]
MRTRSSWSRPGGSWSAARTPRCSRRTDGTRSSTPRNSRTRSEAAAGSAARVPQAGIEPTAYPLGEGRSIQLSYWGVDRASVR